ncbi:hypothetical protein K438DRAFT_1763144 [Mycena galopus ATCC 62051]|nr:hypothetical protein K438DRAFT_1763144 [Mycena galopus ATCC 62051]
MAPTNILVAGNKTDKVLESGLGTYSGWDAWPQECSRYFETTRRARPQAGNKGNPTGIRHYYVRGTQGLGKSCVKARTPEHVPSPLRLHQPRTAAPGLREWGNVLHVHGRHAGRRLSNPDPRESSHSSQ